MAYICEVCQPGYVLSSSSPTCLNCPSDCLYCSTKSACQVCTQGYYLTSSQKCKPCASSCTSCSGSNNNCTVCNSNAYMLQGECFPCFATIPFCVSCQINGTQLECLNCAVGMFVSASSTCESCPQGCSTCSNSTACLTCFPSYFMNN